MTKRNGKINLFIDFDGVIADSVSAACETYNLLFKNFSDFKPAVPEACERYDMLDVCPLCKGDPATLFSEKHFFDILKLTEDDIREYITLFSEKANVIITSIGTAKNIYYKSKWISERLPEAQNAIFLMNIHNKGIIDMDGGIIVDDYAPNLAKSNATHKLAFGTRKWSKSKASLLTVNSFSDISDYLNALT